MSKWRVLLNKEILHLFRDTKTILQTVIIPTFITPLLIGAIFWYISSIAQEESIKTYKVSVYGDSELINTLEESERLNIFTKSSVTDVINDVETEVTDVGLSISSNFDGNLNNKLSGEITIYSKNLDTFSQAKNVIESSIRTYENQIREDRLTELNLDEDFIDPIKVIEEDLTTEEEFAGTFVGAFVAFMFIAYILTGSMYPAIDLGAGEKERGTMETLVSTNISTVEIIIGKMFSITLSAVITAIFSTLGFIIPLILIYLFYADSIPQYAFDVIAAIVNPVAILGIFILIIPLSIFMGSLLLAISIYAKNTKEASLLMGNIVLVFFAPAYVPLINPGMDLDLVGSLIPCFNLALHTNALISGSVDWFLYACSLGSTVIYCLIAVYITYIMFDDEKVIFRS